jgi:hypothetical protein
MSTLLSNSISSNNSTDYVLSSFNSTINNINTGGKIDGKQAVIASKAAFDSGAGFFYRLNPGIPALVKSVDLIADEIIARSTSSMTIDDIYNTIKFVAAKSLILTMYLIFLYNLFTFFILKLIRSKYLYIFYLIISLIGLIAAFVFVVMFLKPTDPSLSQEGINLTNTIRNDILFIYAFPMAFFMYLNYVEMQKLNSRNGLTKKNSNAR